MRNSIQKQLAAPNFSFEGVALDIYSYQSRFNPVYRRFLELSQQLNKTVHSVEDIPFLPISLFKNYPIQTGEWTASRAFSSSGTTGSIPSKHLVRDEQWYLQNAQNIFEDMYGPITNFHVMALLPGYLERSDSSLVAMAQYFMAQADSRLSGFYLNNFNELQDALIQAQKTSRQVLLIGVSFGLLDFAEAYPMDLSNVIIMETGGMKGRRKELIRSELHQLIQQAFKVSTVHSEYGMTELFSQAYSKGEGIYTAGKTMKILLREFNDPFTLQPYGKTGLMNVIDLANLDTCSFIATDDIGKVYANGQFEVLGRYDHSDVRGCNLMVSDL